MQWFWNAVKSRFLRVERTVGSLPTLGVQTFTKVNVYTNFSKAIRATNMFPEQLIEQKKTSYFENNIVFSFSVSKIWERLRSLFKAQSSNSHYSWNYNNLKSLHHSYIFKLPTPLPAWTRIFLNSILIISTHAKCYPKLILMKKYYI